MKVLVIDIGGSHVKMLAEGQTEPRRFDSGEHLHPRELVDKVQNLTADWEYDLISLGYPGAVDQDGIAREPGNLGPGWVGFNFERAFGKPTHVINDAAMQALGAYGGGKMLFLGLGTGVGSALVADRVVVAMELGSLPYESGATLAQRLGDDALKRDGKSAWLEAVTRATEILHPAMGVDYISLGGGNAAVVDPLPPNVRRGHNDDAFTGGIRLWQEPVELQKNTRCAWRVVG